jgi:hypothetical protein
MPTDEVEDDPMQKEADGSHEERMPSPKQSKKIENEKNR